MFSQGNMKRFLDVSNLPDTQGEVIKGKKILKIIVVYVMATPPKDKPLLN